MLATFLVTIWRLFRVLTAWLLRTIRKFLKAIKERAKGSPPRQRHYSRRRKLPEPPRHWRRKPEWVGPVILEMKARNPGFGYIKIAADFNRIYAHPHKVSGGKTWVGEFIKKHRYDIAQLRKRCKHKVPRAMARNRIWGFDATGKGDEHGSVHAIAGLVDHGSRRALALEPVRDRTATGLLKIIDAAVEVHGRPRTLRTDNEAVFKSPVFEAGLNALGIKHRFSKPGCPWQNGRIERLFGTLKEKLDQLVVANIDALDQALAVFRDWYNNIRPHNHLNGLTPRERWDEVDPYRTAPKSVEVFSEWDGLLTGLRIRR